LDLPKQQTKRFDFKPCKNFSSLLDNLHHFGEFITKMKATLQ